MEEGEEVADQVSDLGERALQACRDCEHWGAEVTRLTRAISEEECPHEVRLDPGEYGDPPQSCFSDVKVETTDADNYLPGHGDRPLNLDEIEDEVAHCYSCTRLVGFIRARMEAKKKLGVAKRRVRQVGKLVMREEGR